MHEQRPLVLTPGDPAGIGPDLVAMLANTDSSLDNAVIAADRRIIEQRAEILGLDSNFADYSRWSTDSGTKILHINCPCSVHPGKAQSESADYVLNTIKQAVSGCLDGQFSALVTGPVNKETIHLGGFSFTGHTQYLAELTDAPRAVMLLTDENMRVALVTTHLPLKQVPDAVTSELIVEVTTILNRDLKNRFSIAAPRIAVCGLNPHAGEGGLLGNEERQEIQPAIEQLRQLGIEASGPYPADTIFVPSHARQFDAIVAMYHDQGLPVIKHAAFGEAVNVTLGLPIIRTSVDHGTAYALAGTGNANPDSMRSAISMAQTLVANCSHGASESE